MASGNPEDFKEWPGKSTYSDAATPISFEKYQEVMKSNSPEPEEHTIVYDQRRTAFMTMEDFNKKWNIQ